jgi:hypothetical protein
MCEKSRESELDCFRDSYNESHQFYQTLELN